MIRSKLMTPLLVLALLAIMVGPLFADGDIRDEWLAAYPDVCPDLVAAANDCSLCHDGGLNDYAQDYSGDWLAIGNTDSDGDTVVNNQEINVDCTLPGDPSSVTANEDQTWGAIKVLYN